MTAPIKPGALKLDPLAVFTARAEARALLWKCCAFDLPEAVDVLQRDAVANGLVRELGQDRVQQLLAAAFHQWGRVAQ